MMRIKGIAVTLYNKEKVGTDELRRPIDRAEMIVDKDLWPVPSYADLMFEV